MMDKMQLPDPAVRGPEHKKWQAMVDSVIEFISASKVMLQVLNERILDKENYRIEEERRCEDERTKRAFYEECLHLDLNRVKKRTLLTKEESEKIEVDKMQNFPDKYCLKKNLSRISEETSTADLKQHKKEVLKMNIEQQTDQNIKQEGKDVVHNDAAVQETNNAQNQLNDEEQYQPKYNALENDEKTEVQHQKDDSMQELQPQSVTKSEIKPKSTISLKPCQRPKINPSPSLPTKQTGEIKPKGAKPLAAHHSGNNLIKGQKCSRIPRTRSFNQDQTKVVPIEQNPNEGTQPSQIPCKKVFDRTNTYSHIHRKNKISKVAGSAA